jgi:large subunit ribosomal protein L18
MSKIKKKHRIRKKIYGSKYKPRLSIYKSNKHVYAQLINDNLGKTIVAYCSNSKTFNKELLKKNKMFISAYVAEQIAVKAINKGIKYIVFDRNGYLYHGVVKCFADNLRKHGLIF